jgi:hypothetical protein
MHSIINAAIKLRLRYPRAPLARFPLWAIARCMELAVVLGWRPKT